MRTATRTACAIAALTALLHPTVATAAPIDDTVDAEYVSLGDSYAAAGSFLTLSDPLPRRATTCVNSSDDIGHLVAEQMGVSFEDAACNGASTVDIISGSTLGLQTDALSDATKFVSLSIGGNDDDLFGELQETCFLYAFTCTQEARDDIERKLDALGPRLDVAYAAVRSHAPNAQVVVAGYPRIFPDDADGCFMDVVATQEGVDYLNHVQDRLNGEIAAAAERAGFSMVARWGDGSNSICAPDGQRHVSLTGVGPSDNGIPLHLTLLGRQHQADLIVREFRR